MNDKHKIEEKWGTDLASFPPAAFCNPRTDTARKAMACSDVKVRKHPLPRARTRSGFASLATIGSYSDD